MQRSGRRRRWGGGGGAGCGVREPGGGRVWTPCNILYTKTIATTESTTENNWADMGFIG
jgi:hypothetical protein